MNKKPSNEKNQANIEIKRHSLAHILAAAVLEMFPEAKFGVGPNIENGFYYDFDLPRTLIPEDLPLLEAAMRKIINKNIPFEREEITHENAVLYFNKANQNYKVEILESEANDPMVTVYKTGNFVDLCRGPHIDSAGEIDATSFKLTKIAGAYWRGDEKNKMLQRIYGVAFQNKQELKEYFTQQEEAERRDHRKLGKELDLFVFSDIIGKGLPLWTPKGATLRRELERFIVDEEIKRGYLHVYTPDIAKIDLYKKSGHYPYYKDSMYSPITIDEEQYMLRPMSCPHHFELFLSKPRSYKEMPMRIAEIVKLYRYEKSGELTGLIRVRSFCLADAHIICAKEQAKTEINSALSLIDYIASIFGLIQGKNYRYRLSLGDRKDEKKYFKDDNAWSEAENILREVLLERKANFFEAENEAAFYGPKIDIQMKNIHGKEDTAFTVQYDFVMPKRFNLNFINNEGKEEQAVVIHRSSVGAIERIIGFLIEHYAGAFPVWLAPVQARVVPISTDKHLDYAKKIYADLLANGIRAELDEANETLGKKVRLGEMQKIPYQLVVGDKEIEAESVNIRTRGSKNTETVKTIDFIEKIKKEITDKK